MRTSLTKRALLCGLLASACLPITVTCQPVGDYGYGWNWGGYYEPAYYDEVTYYDDSYYDTGCCGDGWSFDLWFDQWP
jgi:hypothetical protein